MERVGIVTASTLNVRSEPAIAGARVGALPRGSRMQILAVDNMWYEIRSANLTGFVHGDYVALVDDEPASGYLFEMDALQSVARPAAEPISIEPGLSSKSRKVAKAWNDFGGLIGQLSDIVDIDPGCAVAVLCVESSGNGFAADGRMIIRFENHKFWKYWGCNNPDRFGECFRHVKGEAWKGHEFRASANEAWKSFHGRQAGEWEVFDFARALDETAAIKSISMGLPQIMGFNHAAIGYDSTLDMFNNFNADIRYHILGLFDFLRGAGTTSVMLQALQRKQFDLFAAKYNGPGQAAKYGSWIEDHYELFHQLKGD